MRRNPDRTRASFAAIRTSAARARFTPAPTAAPRMAATVGTGMLAAGIESGEFKADLDPRLATYGVLGALNWSHRWFKPGESTAPGDVAAVFVEMFLYGLTTASARGSDDDQSRPGPDKGE